MRLVEHVFIFTLTVLAMSTYLFLTNLTADAPSDDGDYGWADWPFIDVYGYVWSTVWYNEAEETAQAWLHFFCNNEGPQAIRYYIDCAANLKGARTNWQQHHGDHGWVPPFWEEVDTILFDFPMAGRRNGRYTLDGAINLLIKVDVNGDSTFDAIHSWQAFAKTDFNFRRNE